MHGTETTILSTSCPYPGGTAIEFTPADILQLGKLYCWGSAAVSFIVRLRDGREVFVRADRQSKADERFLRTIASRSAVGHLAPGRSEGFRTMWGALLTRAPSFRP